MGSSLGGGGGGGGEGTCSELHGSDSLQHLFNNG